MCKSESTCKIVPLAEPKSLLKRPSRGVADQRALLGRETDSLVALSSNVFQELGSSKNLGVVASSACSLRTTWVIQAKSIFMLPKLPQLMQELSFLFSFLIKCSDYSRRREADSYAIRDRLIWVVQSSRIRSACWVRRK